MFGRRARNTEVMYKSLCQMFPIYNLYVMCDRKVYNFLVKIECKELENTLFNHVSTIGWFRSVITMSTGYLLIEERNASRSRPL